MTKRRFLMGGIGGLLLILCVLLLPFGWQTFVETRYGAHIFLADQVPPQRVAIVFGARVYGSGRLSAMLRDRVDTGIALYQLGKVDKLLMSGDNSNSDYDEPGAMMAYAISQGVPAEDIQPDYGGRRTYDSCYRAQAIFQIDAAILVTQEFHLPRALFLCENLGISAVGVSADRRTYHPRSIAWSEMREIPALVLALVDVLHRAPPPVMGDPIPLFRPGSTAQVSTPAYE